MYFQKIQRPINEDLHLGKTADPTVDKCQTLLKTGGFDKYVLDYLPGMQQISYQDMIYGVNAKESTLI